MRVTEPDDRNADTRGGHESRDSKGIGVDEIAGIIGFILLGLTWFALRGMGDGKPRSRFRR
jgi:hypothetical protein